MATLEERIASLEATFEEVKRMKEGIRGPQGVPGDISVAVANVERAAPVFVKDALKSLGYIDKDGSLKGKTGDAGRNGVDGKDGHTPTKEEIDTAVYRMLHEVGLMTDGAVGEQLLNELQKAVLVEAQKELTLALKIQN